MEATVPRISATRVLTVVSAGFAARAELTEKSVELKQKCMIYNIIHKTYIDCIGH